MLELTAGDARLCLHPEMGGAIAGLWVGAIPLSVSSDTPTTAIVYSPKPDCGFFCIEPVSHPVDAHNLDEMPGLKVLKPGEGLTSNMTLNWGPV